MKIDNFEVVEGEYSYQTRVFAKPIAHYYGKTVIKYRCPLCESLGLRIRVVKDYHRRCPICGVNFKWGNDTKL